MKHLSRFLLLSFVCLFIITGCVDRGVTYNLYALDGYADLGGASEAWNTEEYDPIQENGFQSAVDSPLSTFSIDVDTASYSNLRRYLPGSLPPKDAVRIEEMINYFSYAYPTPTGEEPFALYVEASVAPWNADHKLVHVGIQGKTLDTENLQPSNLVFLIDCSGSMGDKNKLPLLQDAFEVLLEGLGENDTVALVAYAGAAGLVLPPTPATERRSILKALRSLRAGGSTAGGQGIQLAYQTAKEALIEEGNNRVILATDGDFNVGVSSTGALVDLIEEKRQDGIYLTICGFGMGNYKDGRMEQISNAGNGNYFYIDSMKEAEKVFGREMRANLFTIAKDVKIQVEFNPAVVKEYRLIGYENRMLEKEDFEDDTVDAGELGAGHTVTALYEIIPVTGEVGREIPLKYQRSELTKEALAEEEMLTLKLRYKPIDSEESLLIEHIVSNETLPLAATTDAFRFSAAVAGFGMLLRESEYVKGFSYTHVENLAKHALGEDQFGDRAEFLELVSSAKKLD